MTNPVPTNERRDFLPYFRRREMQAREQGFLALFAFMVVIFAASLLVHLFLEPKPVKAQIPEAPPKIMGGVAIIGATEQQIKGFCNGI